MRHVSLKRQKRFRINLNKLNIYPHYLLNPHVIITFKFSCWSIELCCVYTDILGWETWGIRSIQFIKSNRINNCRHCTETYQRSCYRYCACQYVVFTTKHADAVPRDIYTDRSCRKQLTIRTSRSFDGNTNDQCWNWRRNRKSKRSMTKLCFIFS